MLLFFPFFFFFNDTSLREKNLMLQIENRPVFFFSPRVCPFEKVPLTAVQCSRISTEHREGKHKSSHLCLGHN